MTRCLSGKRKEFGNINNTVRHSESSGAEQINLSLMSKTDHARGLYYRPFKQARAAKDCNISSHLMQKSDHLTERNSN